jgi:hypothetical protein
VEGSGDETTVGWVGSGDEIMVGSMVRVDGTSVGSSLSVVLSKSAHTSPTDELFQDLLVVLSVFAARMHGLRKYRDQIAQDPAVSDSRPADAVP